MIDALKEIVEAIGGRKCEIFLDGGIRSGSDIFKAVALGAKAVFIGRPILWGLSYEGEKGVEKILKLLHDEFQTCMKLMGCKTVAEIQSLKNLVVHQSYFKSHL